MPDCAGVALDAARYVSENRVRLEASMAHPIGFEPMTSAFGGMRAAVSSPFLKYPVD